MTRRAPAKPSNRPTVRPCTSSTRRSSWRTTTRPSGSSSTAGLRASSRTRPLPRTTGVRRWVVVRPPGGQTGLLLAGADGEHQVRSSVTSTPALSACSCVDDFELRTEDARPRSEVRHRSPRRILWALRCVPRHRGEPVGSSSALDRRRCRTTAGTPPCLALRVDAEDACSGITGCVVGQDGGGQRSVRADLGAEQALRSSP